MAYSNPLVIDRAKSVFIKKETTAGTPVIPAGTDFLILNDFFTYNQQQNTTDVPAVRASRTKTSKVFNRFDYGTFSGLSISSRPSGSLGTAPTTSESTILECALGGVTTPSTSTVSSWVITGGAAANPMVYSVTAGHTFKVGDIVTVSGDGEATYNVANQLVTAVTSTTVTTNLDGTDGGGNSTAAAATGSPIMTLDLVRYDCKKELPYFSLWIATETGLDNTTNITGGRTLDCLTGCQISQLQITISRDGELRYSIDGSFQRRYYGGSAVTDATTSNGATSISIDTAYTPGDLFFVGQQVQLIHVSGTETMTGGSTVSAVGASSLTVGAVTLSGDMPSGSVVVPYLPTGTISGSVLPQRLAVVCFAASDTDYGTDTGDILESTTPGNANCILSKGGSITLSQNLQTPLMDELTGNDYPSAQFIVENREVTGEMMLVFRMDDAKYYQDITDTPNRAYNYRVGDTAGSIIDFYIPRAFTLIPEDSQEEGAKTLTFNWDSIEPTDGTEEEFRIYYR